MRVLPGGEQRGFDDGDSCEWNWWDWVAEDHLAFRPAFDALVAAGCDPWVLLDTLDWIADRQETRSSPDDIRRIRAGLEEGRHALSDLLHSHEELPF